MTMPSSKRSSKLQKSRPISQALSQAETVVSESMEESQPEPLNELLENDRASLNVGIVQQDDNIAAKSLMVTQEVAQRRQSAGTTNSSPVDPAYIPTKRAVSIVEPSIASESDVNLPSSMIRHPGQSFFDSDTETSDDDSSPIVGRARSVRVITPRIVQSSPNKRESFVEVYNENNELDMDHSLGAIPEQSVGYPQASGVELVNDAVGISELFKGESTLDIAAAKSAAQPHPTSVSAPAQTRHIIDGLHMNPVTAADKDAIRRANTSPLPGDGGRRVRIRPSDLVTIHSNTKPHFRESVVSTPYPSGNTIQDEPYSKGDKITKTVTITTEPQKTATSQHSSKSIATLDRFPSPHQREVLFLNLTLARHPANATTIEIHITDKGTFDDERLFYQIKKAYLKNLLGRSKQLFSTLRTISYVALVHNTVLLGEHRADMSINVIDFLRHLSNPQLGRKRKTWVIWLRNHNRDNHNVISPRQDTDHFIVQKRPLTLSSADKRLSMQSDETASSFNFHIFPPLSVARLPFFRDRAAPKSDENKDLEKGGEDVTQLSGSNNKGSASSPQTDTVRTGRLDSLYNDENRVLHSYPKLEIHHAFNFWVLVVLSLITIFLSITATILWIVFGVPGSLPGHRDMMSGSVNTTTSMITEFNWEYAAQTRVLTGLVLGLVVLVLGGLLEAGLIAGAWIMV